MKILALIFFILIIWIFWYIEHSNNCFDNILCAELKHQKTLYNKNELDLYNKINLYYDYNN